MLDDTWLDGLAFMGLPGATDVEMADGKQACILILPVHRCWSQTT